jgi:hypothetical protein
MLHGEGEYLGKLLPVNRNTLVQKNSVIIMGWKKGISGKAPGFMRENSRLGRVWSATSRLVESGKVLGLI